MKVLVGIVTHNRREVLVKAIESALAQTYEPKEIIVIDDASTDDTISLSKQYPQVQWRRNEVNKGYRHGRQTLMMEEGHHAYCSLDDDSWFLQADDLAKAVSKLAGDSNLGAIAFTIKDRGPCPIRNRDSSPSEVAWYIGCGHLLRSSIVRTLGGYGSFPGRYGCEEKDLSIRLLDAGYQVIQSRKVTVWHDVSFEARPVPKLHASGMCNDLTFDLLRCPSPFLFWQIPKKLLSHFLFVLRFAWKSTESLQQHDRRIRQRWGRGVYLKPYFAGLVLFLRQSACLLSFRAPVSRDTYEEYRRRMAFS